MVSLYDSFAMFPATHGHPGGMSVGPAGGGGPAVAAAAAAAVAAGHQHPHHHAILGNRTHPHHQTSGVAVQHHPHHHQMAAAAAANQAYHFGYSHPHHWGGPPGANGQSGPAVGHQYNGMTTNIEHHHHQQQFVGGLVTSDGGNSWHHPSPASAVYSAGLSSNLSPARTPNAYDEWASSPVANTTTSGNGNNQTGNVVSSPDASPAGQFDQAAAAAAYGGALFIPPHHHHHHHLQQDVHHRMNLGAPTIIAAPPGHHSPDSGLAGSDGLSSAGSPAQQQQGMLGSSAGINISQQGQQQSGSNQQQPGMTGGNVSRPQPSRSPFEWMKKPSYNTNTNSNPAGKTRTKDKYRVVYTDHQRLELEKEFHYSRYITIRRKSELASVLGLSERQVKIWFQNRRAKERKQVKKREEMLHKDNKLDVPVQQQPQQQQQMQQHHVQQQQHNMHMQGMPPSMNHHMGSVVQMDTKPSVLGLD